MNDLERKLSDALHTLTPEPPTAFRFNPRADDAGDPACEVIDLDGVIDLDVARRRRRPKLGLLLAAAAVVILGGGIAAAAVAFDRTDTAPAGSDRTSSPTPAVAACRSDNIVLSFSDRSVSSGKVTVRLSTRNSGGSTCALGSFPKVFLDQSSGTTADSSDRLRYGTGWDVPRLSRSYLVLRSNQSLVYSLTMISSGTCRTSPASSSVGIAVLNDTGFEYSGSLRIGGCTVAPSSLFVSKRG